MSKRFEPLIWERAAADPADPRGSEPPEPRAEHLRLAQSATVRRMARMNHALKTAGFDPDWDIRKCARVECGKTFKLTPGRGQWAKRRYCSEACRNADRQARSRNRLITG